MLASWPNFGAKSYKFCIFKSTKGQLRFLSSENPEELLSPFIPCEPLLLLTPSAALGPQGTVLQTDFVMFIQIQLEQHIAANHHWISKLIPPGFFHLWRWEKGGKCNFFTAAFGKGFGYHCNSFEAIFWKITANQSGNAEKCHLVQDLYTPIFNTVFFSLSTTYVNLYLYIVNIVVTKLLLFKHFRKKALYF